MSAYEILIAEDDPVLRGVYEKKFTIAGHSIRTAENGEEAKKLLAEKKPDLLILDINMPIVDGFEVLESIPKETRDFPVILLTNYSNENTKNRGMQLGADDYFIKSEMTIKSLIAMVDKLLA